MFIRLPVLLLAVSALLLFADPPRPVNEAVSDVFTPVPNDLQRLGGLFASRMRANTEGYLEHFAVKDIARSLRKPGLPGSSGASEESLPSGKAAGLLLAAAANTYEYTDDPQVKGVMDHLATELAADQQADGYIGSFPSDLREKHDDLSAQGAILSGLLAYTRVTGNEESLAVSRRMANRLLDHLSKGKGAVEDAREILPPLLDLYRSTGDGRYLSFGRKLAQSSLSSLSTEVDPYSFLSFLSGLTDLYQLTGDEAYVKAAVNGWRTVRDNRLTITGTPGGAESARATDSSASSGGCFTQAWLRLNLDLFRIRGDAQYADQLERTVYNQLLASQDPRSGEIDPCLPASGTKKPSFKVDACTSALALSISEIPEGTWGRHGSGVAVIAYQPGRATLRLRRRATLQLYAEGDYLQSGKLLLHIEPSHDVRFPLRLLVPSWTREFSAEIGDTRLKGTPGEFLVLDREWKKGDTVKISVALTVRRLTDSKKHPGEIAIGRGPQVLALIGGDPPVKDLAAAGLNSASFRTTLDPDSEGAFTVPGEYLGKNDQLKFLPFADAVNFRVWLKASSNTSAGR